MLFKNSELCKSIREFLGYYLANRSDGVSRLGSAILILILSCVINNAWATGGPLGIDHRWNYHDSGIWSRSTQNTIVNGLIAADVVSALWNGGDDRSW